MRIGEVATAAGVSVQTLRYYDRCAIIEALDKRPP